VNAGQTTWMEETVDRSAVVTGRVVDAHDTPVRARAQVRVDCELYGRKTTVRFKTLCAQCHRETFGPYVNYALKKNVQTRPTGACESRSEDAMVRARDVRGRELRSPGAAAATPTLPGGIAPSDEHAFTF
jgi:hypothetical protein